MEYDSNNVIEEVVRVETTRVVQHIRRRVLVAALARFGWSEASDGFTPPAEAVPLGAPVAPTLLPAAASPVPIAESPPQSQPAATTPAAERVSSAPRYAHPALHPRHPVTDDVRLARALLDRYKGEPAHAVQALRYRIMIPLFCRYVTGGLAMTEEHRADVREALARPLWTYRERLAHVGGPVIMRHRVTDDERARIFATWRARHGSATIEARALAGVLIAAKAFVEVELAGRSDDSVRLFVGWIVDFHLRGLVVDGHAVDMVEDNGARLYALQPVAATSVAS